jgi:ATP-binding cassette, subfamily B, bacterial
MGVLVLQVRNLLTTLLPIGRGGEGITSYVSTLLPLGTIVMIQAINNIIAIYQNQQQLLLTELVQRYTAQPVMQVVTGVELREFESPAFHNRLALARAAATTKPQQVTSAVLGMGRGILISIGLAGALLLLSWPLFLIAILGVVPLWFANLAMARGAFQFITDSTTNDRQRAYIFDLATATNSAKEVRAFGLASFLRKRYDELTVWRIERLRSSLGRRTLIALAGALGTTAFAGATIAFVALLLLHHLIGLPEAGAALAAVSQLGGQLQSLMTNGSMLYQSSLFVDELNSFLSLAPKVECRDKGILVSKDFSRIELRNVHFRYPREVRAVLLGAESPNRIHDQAAAGDVAEAEILQGVSMEIRRGEVVALVGENGSGKTTIAKLLAGLYRPNPGEIFWDGLDVSQADLNDLREHVTIVFQDFVRYMLTVRENIGLGRVSCLEDEPGIRHAARLAGASDFIEQRLKGYDTMLGRVFPGGDELSMGQWQRIALARTFFRAAPLIVLDEPTASQDAKAESELFNRVRELFVGRSVLLISHRFSSVRAADRIYVLKHGRIVETGTHLELMEERGVYAEMFSLQAAPYVRDDAPNVVNLRSRPAAW